MTAARRALPVVLAVLLGACASAAPVPPVTQPSPTMTSEPTPVVTPADPTAEPTTEPTTEPTVEPTEAPTVPPTPSPSPTPTPPPSVDDLVGQDGRFTVLVLGSDARPKLPGYRTDAIILMTIDPTTGQVAGVSLPRDTVDVPTGPGRAYHQRINVMMQELEVRRGSRAAAAQGMKAALAHAFRIEIDHYVFMGFGGFETLIDTVGGVDVVLERGLVDSTYRYPGRRKRGVRFPAGENHLNATRALAFARTRHADNDYARSARQQQIIVSAARAIRDQGAAVLPALLAAAADVIETDLPLDAAPALLDLLGRARLDRPASYVLSPYRYAYDGTVLYTTVLRMDVVRALFARHFSPVSRP